MSLLPTIGAVDQDTGFYNGVATTSYRNIPGQTLTLDYGASPTSTKIMSFGGWIKRQKVGFYSNLLSATLGGGGVAQGYIFINGSDVIAVQDLTAGGATTFSYITNRVIRDTSAWMHLWVRIDTTDSTEGDRVQLWVNGVRETSFSTATAPSLNDDTVGLNQNKTHFFGHSNASYGGNIYYCDWYWLDGSAVTPVDTVGEFKNGVFIPKEYSSASFGNKGWHLKFDQTGVGSPSTSTIGADSSGNNRHWTSTANTNVEAHDCAMPDSPENNFPTWNSIAPDATYSITTISEGNLKSQNTPNNNKYSEINFRLDETNKYYFEYYNITTTGALQPASFELFASSTNKASFYITTSGNIYVDGSSIGSSFPTLSAGDIVNIAFDGASGKLWFGKNGTYYNASGSATGNPADGTNPIATLTSAEFKMSSTFYQQGAIMNFGQDSSFAGNKTSGSENAQDANGIGDFYDTPPSGYLALCSANLSDDDLPISPAKTTQADDHFNTILYSGDGQTTQDVTGVGFAPDWTWIKERSSSSGHVLADSSRGYDKYLAANETIDEGTGVLNSRITSGTGGFQTTNSGATNQSSQTYVAWNWKANNGVTSSNSDGSITSTVQANTDAGFSIVTYTGNATIGATIGHGLGVKPAWILFKNRDSTAGWATYHKALGATKLIYLDLTNSSVSSDAHLNNTEPTNTLITLHDHVLTNGSDAYVAYCFAEIEGYSRFGSFVGNGSADGTFVFTGFRPAWLMVKRSDSTNNWHIWDTTRGTFNPMGTGSLLVADNTYYESQLGSVLDILSNGFKPRANSTGYNNGSYIYMAFAEAPFKYANAR